MTKTFSTSSSLTRRVHQIRVLLEEGQGNPEEVDERCEQQTTARGAECPPQTTPSRTHAELHDTPRQCPLLEVEHVF